MREPVGLRALEPLLAKVVAVIAWRAAAQAARIRWWTTSVAPAGYSGSSYPAERAWDRKFRLRLREESANTRAGRYRRGDPGSSKGPRSWQPGRGPHGRGKRVDPRPSDL